MYKLLKVKYVLVIDGRDVSGLLMLREYVGITVMGVC